MKYTISATIATAQYSNIVPSIEVEAESLEEAERIVLPYIESLSARYAEAGKELTARGSQGKKRKLVSPLDGGYVFFDEENHVYTDSNGKVYKSGSTFAEDFKTPFNKDMIAKNCEKSWGMTAGEILDMWDLNGNNASGFGTAMHGALECYGKYGPRVADKALPKHPFIKKVVEDFFKDRKAENALYEPLVVDMEGLRCGQIDRLVILDKEKKTCIIEDYKFTMGIREEKKEKQLKAPFDELPPCDLSKNQVQLSFYADILRKLGWTVEKLRIHNWIGEWETIELEVLDLK